MIFWKGFAGLLVEILPVSRWQQAINRTTTFSTGFHCKNHSSIKNMNDEENR